MQPTFSHLPLPLVLLIHLHILNYPYANEPQYDNNLFDGRLKGLKNRVKMMEDICYFLVSQLESTNARNILPTYPCSQPSDSLAFRTSLFKYLEAIRHRALFSSSSQKSSANVSRGQYDRNDKEGGLVRGVAWWWKDVVVRKSLLEECSGEKFERLLVAFSTQVLFYKSGAYTHAQILDLAKTSSASYSTLLSRFQSKRVEWIQKATLLSQRRQKLELLRSMIFAGGNKAKLQERSTEHLLAIVKVKYNDIRDRLWKGQQGSAALANLFHLAGLSVPGANEVAYVGREVSTSLIDIRQQPAQPPILPIAAAHHPAELKRLRRSVVSSRTRVHDVHIDPKISLPACTLLSSDVVSAERMHQRFSGALSEAQKTNERLVNLLKSRRVSNQHKSHPIHFPWTMMTKGRELLRKPIVDDLLLERLSLPRPGSQDAFERRIEYIRQHLLPPFPSPPDLCAPRVIPHKPNVPASQLPRPKPGFKTYQKELQQSTEMRTPKNLHAAKKPRKSIRASIAHNMVKHADEARKQTFEDEASKIILATEDNSMEDDEVTTPRSGAPPNRIWTSGQKRTPRMNARTPRKSSILIKFGEPSAELPLVPATSTGSMSLLDAGDDDEDECEKIGVEGNERRTAVLHSDGDSEGGEYSQTSMTLRELLLAADSSGFDLIGDEEEDCVETYPGWE